LAIENARGGTLADLIKRRCGDNYANPETFSSAVVEPLSENDCAKIVKGILLGLKHIHS
jgi:serine/threonine protein kinase